MPPTAILSLFYLSKFLLKINKNQKNVIKKTYEKNLFSYSHKQTLYLRLYIIFLSFYLNVQRDLVYI